MRMVIKKVDETIEVLEVAKVQVKQHPLRDEKKTLIIVPNISATLHHYDVSVDADEAEKILANLLTVGYVNTTAHVAYEHDK